jgi:urease accessory protein
MLTLSRRLTGALLLILLPFQAAAHAGSDVGSFLHGLAHPASGLDHVLAMTATGLLAARLGGRALWLAPTSFILLMIVGAGLAHQQNGWPYVEAAVVLSVIVLGSLLAFPTKLGSIAVVALASAFAIFHGHAHGTEMSAGASPAAYAAGFVATTLILNLVGIGVASGLARISPRGASCERLLGAGIALAGCGILLGAI